MRRSSCMSRQKRVRPDPITSQPTRKRQPERKVTQLVNCRAGGRAHVAPGKQSARPCSRCWHLNARLSERLWYATLLPPIKTRSFPLALKSWSVSESHTLPFNHSSRGRRCLERGVFTKGQALSVLTFSIGAQWTTGVPYACIPTAVKGGYVWSCNT